MKRQRTTNLGTKGEVVLSAKRGDVFVAAEVDPKAAQYAVEVQARQAKRRLPKHIAQVGGESVSIPKLDGDHQAGLTMAQQAAMQSDTSPEAMRQIAGDTRASLKHHGAEARKLAVPVENSIVEMPVITSMAPPQQQGMPNPGSMGILPTDTLPVEATKDPSFQQGYGSMFAASQPQLAARYGVVRSGNTVPPHKLRGGKAGPGLSSKSVQDLETLQKLQQQSQATVKVAGLHETEEEAEAHMEGSAAAASARAGNLPGDSSHLPTKRREKAADNEEEKVNIDELDFDQYRQRMMKDILNNKGQQASIEKKLDPLKIEDLILHNRIQQVVPIVKGFQVTFQSMTGDEDLAMKRLIMEESNSVEVSDRYLLDKYSIMSLAVGTFAVNGKPLGDHTNDKGVLDDKLFWKKFKRVLRLPTHMIASIGANHFWFEQRVRRLFVAETVGNG